MEHLPDALDAQYTQYWPRDYIPWRQEQDAWAEQDGESIVEADNGTIRLDKLELFLDEPQTRFYQSMISYTKNE